MKIVLISIVVSIFSVRADFEYYKNTLIGGRASGMGGAYVAISDDVSGAFYNPAGMSFAQWDSLSGSANVFQVNKSTYEGVIGDRDWNRDTQGIAPNFFGVLKRNKRHSFAFVYALTDFYKEDQDESHQNITNVSTPISIYSMNLHTEDSVMLIGPSYSYRFKNDNSIGLSLFYHKRDYQQRQYQHIEFTDSTDEYTYKNLIKKEKAIKPKLGFQFSSSDKWVYGLTFSKSIVFTAFNDIQQGQKRAASTGISYVSSSNIAQRETPYEASFGLAYYKNSFTIYSMDLDYFYATDVTKEDVINLSFGLEHFVTEKRAWRFGLYSNRSNSIEPSDLTSAPVEHVDLYGVSLGHAFFTPTTSISVGAVVSYGKGDAQIFSSSSGITTLEKLNIALVLSSDYGF